MSLSAVPASNKPRPIRDEGRALRPATLDDFTGQADQRERLKIAVESALAREEPCDHIILSGPPGLGKTSLSMIMADALGGKLVITSGPAIRKPTMLIEFLRQLEWGDILLIDEIHALPKIVEETLYPAMEDYRVEIQDPLTDATYQMPIEPFTLIGATTRKGAISRPLRERFGLDVTLEYYATDDMERIVARSASLLGLALTQEATHEIASASRGTPRIANNLVRRVRDYSLVRTDNTFKVGLDACRAAMLLEGIDANGMNMLDRRYLRTLMVTYGGGPVGIKPLVATMSVDEDDVTDVIEPYLLHEGYLARTTSGRCITVKGRQYAERMGLDK